MWRKFSGLDEVVVVGYGTQAEKDITGGCGATVKGEPLARTKTADLTRFGVAGRSGH